jgi:hypothetical protein
MTDAVAYRIRLTGGPNEGTVVYHLGVREPSADVVDALLADGWGPATPNTQEALATTVLFLTTDEDVAFTVRSAEAWASTEIMDAEEVTE